MPRKQVNDLPSAPKISPAARMIDTFVSPSLKAPENTDGIKGLADALSSINPSIQNYLVQEKQEMDTTDIAAGVAAFNKNRVDFKEAVKQGLIPAGASPHYRRAYKGSQLKVAGQAFLQELKEDYAKSNLQNSDDPNAFTDFVRERVQANAANKLSGFTDSEVSNYFVPEQERAISAMQQHHTAARVEVIETGLVTSIQTEIVGMIDNNLDDNDEAGSAAALGEGISNRLKDAIENGLDGTKANKAAAEAIILAAKAEGDEDILDTLSHIRTGTGRLSDTASVRAAATAARDHIISQQQRSEKHAVWQRDEQKKQVADATMGQVLTVLMDNPTADLTPVVKELAKVDPDMAAKLLTLQDASLARGVKVYEDPERVAELMQRITEKGANGPKIILDAAERGIIGGGTVSTLYSLYSRNKKHDTAFDTDAYRATSKYLERTIGGDEANYGGEKAHVAFSATLALRRSAISWLEKNKDDNGQYDDVEYDMYLSQRAVQIVNDPRYGLDLEDVNKRLSGEANQPKPASDAKPAQASGNANPYADAGMTEDEQPIRDYNGPSATVPLPQPTK